MKKLINTIDRLLAESGHRPSQTRPLREGRKISLSKIRSAANKVEDLIQGQIDDGSGFDLEDYEADTPSMTFDVRAPNDARASDMGFDAGVAAAKALGARDFKLDWDGDELTISFLFESGQRSSQTRPLREGSEKEPSLSDIKRVAKKIERDAKRGLASDAKAFRLDDVEANPTRLHFYVDSDVEDAEDIAYEIADRVAAALGYDDAVVHWDERPRGNERHASDFTIEPMNF